MKELFLLAILAAVCWATSGSVDAAEAREALPDSFYRGPGSFEGHAVSSAGSGPTVPGGVNATAWGGSAVAFNGGRSASGGFVTLNATSSPSGMVAQPAQPRVVTA